MVGVSTQAALQIASGPHVRYVEPVRNAVFVDDHAHMHEVRAFAASVGAQAALDKQLERLAQWGDGFNYEIHISKSLAPWSLAYWMRYRALDGTWTASRHGLLLYFGPGEPDPDVPMPEAVHDWVMT